MTEEAVDDDLVRETLSFEMMMQLAISHHKRQRKEQERGLSPMSTQIRSIATPASLGEGLEEFKTTRNLNESFKTGTEFERLSEGDGGSEQRI